MVIIQFIIALLHFPDQANTWGYSEATQENSNQERQEEKAAKQEEAGTDNGTAEDAPMVSINSRTMSCAESNIYQVTHHPAFLCMLHILCIMCTMN